MSKKFTSNSEEETIEFGREFGIQLSAGGVVALEGALGSGKTHMVKGIADALGIKKSSVHSPTYTLINEYKGNIPLFHFDFYRINSPEEALEIGTEEYFYREGICVIEWPENISSILPDDVAWIKLKSTGKTQRVFEVMD